MASNILYLRSENFGIDKITTNGSTHSVLCNSIKGVSVVLFYSGSRCAYSRDALSEFKRVAPAVNGIVFGAIDIDNAMAVVRLARSTVTRIEGVPYIMLYLNGIPRQVYPDTYEMTAPSIQNFATTIAARLLNTETRQAAPPPDAAGGGIYFIAVPLKRKNVTYVSQLGDTR